MSAEASQSLRSLQQGQLKTSPGFGGSTARPYLPLDGRSNSFLSAEARANENMALTSIHVLFMREHNRIAASLSSANPHWSDERLFLGSFAKIIHAHFEFDIFISFVSCGAGGGRSEARSIVQAMYQHIIYNEYVPAIIGLQFAQRMNLLAQRPGRFFEGYDDSVNASVSNEFSAGAFRFGHTLVRSRFSRFNATMHNMFAPVELSNMIFNIKEVFL